MFFSRPVRPSDTLVRIVAVLIAGLIVSLSVLDDNSPAPKNHKRPLRPHLARRQRRPGHLVRLRMAQRQLQRALSNYRQVESELNERERFIRHVTESSPQLIYLLDLPTRRTVYTNRSLAMQLGYNTDGVSDQLFFDVLHPDDTPRLTRHFEHLATANDGEVAEVEFRVRAADGSLHWLISRDMVFMRMPDGTVLQVLGTAMDVTDRKRAEARLRHDALHDALTGLPNRVLVLRRLARSLEQLRRYPDQRFAVLFLDLDRFKLINDSLGRLAGDQVLLLIARRLESCLRGCDTVARLGGDEFLVVLDTISELADAVRVAERIHHALGSAIVIDGQEVFTATSIGIAVGTTEYRNPEDLLRDADNALYRAKSLGRGRTAVFDAALHEHAVALFQLETDLRHALERHELCLHYQPIVTLPEGLVRGFEALIRWQHPVRGLLAPTQFLPVAEECGLGAIIGSWVLRQACMQVASWQARYRFDPPLMINVNLSNRQLNHPALIDQVATVLRETGIAPEQLCLEITENIVLEQDLVLPTLEGLRALGLQLHIDDFGTGYSSLSVLHQLPIDVLKIDRSFVQSLGTPEQTSAIARTIVMLARELGLKVIAEGIECAEQAAALSALGSDFGQGYWFARPLECDAAEQLLLKQASGEHLG